jgi:hypothetical protein
MPTKFERSIKLRAIRISKADFENIVSGVEKLITSANKATDRQGKYFAEVSDGIESVTASSWTDGDFFKHSPSKSYECVFKYSNSDESPVTNVALKFSDIYRKIEVSGCDSSQVESITSHIRAKLTPYTTFFGGLEFSSIFRGAAWVIGMILIMVITLSIQSSVSLWVSVPFNLLSSLLVGISFLGNFRFFSGFILFEGSTSFLVRQSAAITFWSFVLGVLSISLTIYQLWPSKS